jgi:hypothetical protein
MAMASWISEIIGSGITAVAGFFAKHFWDYYNTRKQLTTNRIRKVENLKGLLEESRNLYEMQNKLLRRLCSEICERTKCDESYKMSGYEYFLTHNFDNMTEVERDTHSIIRGTTMNSIQIVNAEMLKWMKDDNEFKINSVKQLRASDLGEEFAAKLNKLELHLNLWRDKYNIWMENEKHCVVYLDDEEKHGEGFPIGIEDMVDEVLAELVK